MRTNNCRSHGACPSYASVRRYLKAQGLWRKRPPRRATDAALAARDRLEQREVRNEHQYHRTVHSELGCTPMQRYLAGPNVGRECPGSDELRAAFRLELKRRQRRSDGTVSLHGQRFEIPSRYCHLLRSDAPLRRRHVTTGSVQRSDDEGLGRATNHHEWLERVG